MELFLIAAVTILITILIVKLIKSHKRVIELETKYSKILDIEEYVKKFHHEKVSMQKKISEMKQDYKEKRVIFDQLRRDVSTYDEDIELIELGFYKSHFDFDTSHQYKSEIIKIKQQQKDMVRSQIAISCAAEWKVEGSRAKGKAMTNRGIKLTARAFNNECEAAISNVRWNNVTRMEARLEKAFESINKLNQSTAIVISDDYLNLKLDELRLAYEYSEKKQQEKEEQLEIKRQIREEAKLEKELSKAIKEEEKYKKMLEAARLEAEQAAGKELELLNEKISQLSDELESAHQLSERAKSMAQQTKTGHIYVISNIGSFGDDIYKIGMTRRLEPLDRVKELGDASVPFTFDVHAMIHTEDAPALENALHKKFEGKRLNLVNNRKEFFAVNLQDIEKEVLKINPKAEFIETAEAKEFRESQSILATREQQSKLSKVMSEYPETL
ncbi:hypothetical protein A9Q78_11380 [Methylophaga sp. 41_12_T18]|nr:hypothetical protein A9Q78_11380 [Methylophaga sp. 41_12_T18]